MLDHLAIRIGPDVARSRRHVGLAVRLLDAFGDPGSVCGLPRLIAGCSNEKVAQTQTPSMALRNWSRRARCLAGSLGGNAFFGRAAIPGSGRESHRRRVSRTRAAVPVWLGPCGRGQSRPGSSAAFVAVNEGRLTDPKPLAFTESSLIPTASFSRDWLQRHSRWPSSDRSRVTWLSVAD